MLETARQFDDPAVTQLAVFLQNRVGELREVLKHLSAAQVIVHALSVADSVDYAIVRLIVDRSEQAVLTLREAGFAVTQSTLIAVELNDDRQGLSAICNTLIQAEINLHYAYPMFTRPRGRGVIVINVDSPQIANEMLRKAGFALLDETDLASAP